MQLHNKDPVQLKINTSEKSVRSCPSAPDSAMTPISLLWPVRFSITSPSTVFLTSPLLSLTEPAQLLASVLLCTLLLMLCHGLSFSVVHTPNSLTPLR